MLAADCAALTSTTTEAELSGYKRAYSTGICVAVWECSSGRCSDTRIRRCPLKCVRDRAGVKRCFSDCSVRKHSSLHPLTALRVRTATACPRAELYCFE